MKKITKYIICAIAIAGASVLLFSSLGVAVFLLPLLGGAFKVNA